MQILKIFFFNISSNSIFIWSNFLCEIILYPIKESFMHALISDICKQRKQKYWKNIKILIFSNFFW